MTGTVELDREGAHLLIRFPYREDLVAEVKNVPGRRWDSRQKTWRVPTAQVELVYATFSRHLFEFAPEVSSLLAGTLGGAPRAPAVTVPVAATATADAISVSTLNERVRGILRGGFEGSFWLVGEIVDLDKQGGRQHRFFSLVEKAPGEARPRARVEAALFEGTARTLLPRLAAGGTEFTLRDGIEIRALVHVDLYVPTGRFQVVVDDIDPTFTLGKLALSREAVLLELQKLQLAERNRSLPLPTPARRIGVLASPDSDGWNDFLRQLQESGIGFDLTLVPVRVQGAELRPSMLAALAWLAERAADFDAVCILRGGGSRTDLAGFDDRDVALAVARHPLKILIGIGHQRDLSVLDAIAHSEKTPTAVAAFLVRCALEAATATATQAARLWALVDRRLAAARSTLSRDGRVLQRVVVGRLHAERSFELQASRDLGRGAARQLLAARQQLNQFVDGLGSATARRFERLQARLDEQAARQRLLDPRAVLRRGYALVRDDRGRVLASAAQVQRGQLLTLALRDGSVHSRVESIDLDPST